MIKSGIIAAFVMLLLATGATLLSPICVPCIALLVGAVAGYIACAWSSPQPQTNSKAAQNGAVAGAIGGAGALLGQFIGGLFNAWFTDPNAAMQTTEDIMERLGQQPLTLTVEEYQTFLWAGTMGMAGCIGLLDIALMAGLGALGGVIWWQMTGKQQMLRPLYTPTVDLDKTPK